MQLRFTYILGFVALIIAAFFSQGFHHFDEHFQILEFAALKLGLTTPQQLPWEYHAQMRSALQPAMAYIAHKLLFATGIHSPFAVTTFLRLLSALASFYASTKLIDALSTNIYSERLRKNLVLFSFLLWFAIYNFVRFSSENWCGISMALAVASLYSNKNNYAKYILAGIAMGFAFLFRFQAGIMIVGIFLWLLIVRKEGIKWILLSGFCLCQVLLLGLLIDRWFYGTWVLSGYNYFCQTILSSTAPHFASQPWYYFVSETFLSALPPFSLLYIAAAIGLIILKPKHLITYIAVPFIIVHTFIGHKEMRFLFPLLYFLPFAIATTVESTSIPHISVRIKNGIARLFWISNIALLLIVMFRPADSLVSLYRNIYFRHPTATTLYYTVHNPYFHVADINYYKRQNLRLVQINSIDEIPVKTSDRILFATISKDENMAHMRNAIPIYTSLPTWLKPFNFNHWQERTAMWRVYEIEEKL